MMKKTLILISATMIVVACASKKAITMSQVDADRAATKFPGTTLASLNQGKQHYEDNCGKCHGLKKTTDYNEAQWRKVMPPMAEKAKIDKKTEDLILAYVVTMGKP